jgi:uncharacterized iron-regulated membrane protein
VVSRWLGGLIALFVTAAGCVLVTLDVNDDALRRWWDGHAMTTDVVGGLLVLLITVLVVDQVVLLRQINDRSRTVAVQAGIMVSQASRTTQAISASVDGSGDRDAAAEEFRTYIMMLLAVAPVLIDAKLSRAFLEQAQRLGGVMARALNVIAGSAGQQDSVPGKLDAGLQALKSASTPLLANLDPAMRAAVTQEDSA